jgi:S1-C subfamily serine protease
LVNRAFARFRSGGGIRLGDDIVVTGFPLSGLLRSDMVVSTGTVSSLGVSELGRDFIQISAQVQPGSSGGPVMDRSGQLVGVVSGSIDAAKVFGKTGALPQNVNFALSLRTILSFLDTAASSLKCNTSPQVRCPDANQNFVPTASA